MILTHDIGRSIEVRPACDQPPRLAYVYAGKPKPYFHPLRTPAGHVLTLFEPHDHLWHRGLWFTIKFINGENFWEENCPHGTQRTLRPPAIIHHDSDVIEVVSEQEWLRPDPAQGGVFRERRRFVYRGGGEDAYCLDFETHLAACADLLLDRTVYTTWGGYGGLVFRGSRNWQETRLLFSDGQTRQRPIGETATWCDLSGKLDGGAAQTGGIAILDDPYNPRHPTPWYGSVGPGHYFNAAFLFHEPMRVEKDQTLHFRYRVIVHDGIWDLARLAAEYERYTAALPGT
jgi:hypothetical protein